METRTGTALPSMVEAIEGDLGESASALEAQSATLSALEDALSWIPSLASRLRGVRLSLDQHTAALREESRDARERLLGTRPAITEQRNEELVRLVVSAREPAA